MRAFNYLFATALVIFGIASRADTINLTNGDRFTGSIELVDATEVHLKSDSVGTIKIPRAKVISIFFGTNQPPIKTLAGPEKDSATTGGLFDPKSVDKVQEDFLATAGPEANAMFKDLIQGLASGKLNVEDIRDQARESLKGLKELQADGGEEADNPLIQGYVGILENFINKGSTNRAKTGPANRSGAPAPKSGDE
jgi:hypothetical protein